MGRAGPLAAGALASPARGRVAAVHRRAAILELEGGPLVVLLPESTPLHPWALTAALTLRPVAEGAEFRVTCGALHIGAERVPLDGARVADLRIRNRPARPDPAPLPLLEPAAPGDPFEPALGEALATFAAGAEVEALGALVGLGAGLTPSGDDVLVGILAALDWGRDLQPGAAAIRRRLIAALPAPLGARTPRLSAQLLRAAADGLYAEPILDLLDTMTLDETASEHAGRAIQVLLEVGHRSGADTLRGIAAALARLGLAGAGPAAAAGFPRPPPAG